MRRVYAQTLSFASIHASFSLSVSLRFFVLLVILVSLQGCFFNATRYKGDGSYTDNGWYNYQMRYILDLGVADLSKPGTFRFELTGLPKAQFNVGIDVLESLTTGLDRQFDQPTRVKLEIRTSVGKAVIVEEGPLGIWVLSSAFPHASVDWARFYKRGETEEMPNASGVPKTTHLNVKHPEGWGTYFTASRFETYMLELTVLESESYVNAPAKLVLMGWDRTL